MASLVKELEQVSLKQAEQLKDIAHLRNEAKTAMNKKERELIDKHRNDMAEAEQKWTKQIDEYCSKAALVKLEMEKEIVKLKEKHKCELEALRSSVEEEARESQKWEQRERTVQEQMKLKEQSLAERVSGLSDELRTVKDQLVLSRQKINQVTEQLGTAQNDTSEVQRQLEEAHKEKDELVSKLTSLQVRLDTAEKNEKMLREQLSENEGKTHTCHNYYIDGISDAPIETIGGMKAMHTESIAGLKAQLMTLHERIQVLENEKEIITSQHHSTIQKQSNSLSSVEMVYMQP